MTTDQWAIWWTTSDDVNHIQRHFGGDLVLPEMVPQYIRDEFASRAGRNARGRLWVPDLEGAPQRAGFSEEYPTALQDHCATAGGIVIRAEHVERLQHLPGIVTTLGLEGWP